MLEFTGQMEKYLGMHVPACQFVQEVNCIARQAGRGLTAISVPLSAYRYRAISPGQEADRSVAVSFQSAPSRADRFAWCSSSRSAGADRRLAFLYSFQRRYPRPRISPRL